MSKLALNNPSLLEHRGYINGAWVVASDKATLSINNPANGEVVSTVPAFSAAETMNAIEGAEQAFHKWKMLTAKERADHLYAWHKLIAENSDDLAQIMTAEQGKPLKESRAEIAYANSFVRWFAEEARRTYGEVIPAPKASQRILTTRHPVGVVAAITPWNFPAAMITRKVAPALAAGCTVVLKPASATPLSALGLVKLAEEAGIPAGVFNVITGNAETIGGVLTSHPLVRKVSFTGSTQVGKSLMQSAAATVKKISLELGGNAPFIVFDDADMDRAITGLMHAKFRNTGQTCISTNRILLQEGIADRFIERISSEIKKLHIGDGADEKTDIGPLINQAAVIKIESLLKDAVERGATLVSGGTRHSLGRSFMQPGIVTGVTPDMTISQEEIFGPILAITRFASEAEAVTLANATPYGLAAYVYTSDHNRIWRIADQLEYGMIGLNDTAISNEVAPFGGIKESGIGREGSLHGIAEYMEIKYLCLGGLDREE